MARCGKCQTEGESLVALAACGHIVCDICLSADRCPVCHATPGGWLRLAGGEAPAKDIIAAAAGITLVNGRSPAGAQSTPFVRSVGVRERYWQAVDSHAMRRLTCKARRVCRVPCLFAPILSFPAFLIVSVILGIDTYDKAIPRQTTCRLLSCGARGVAEVEFTAYGYKQHAWPQFDSCEFVPEEFPCYYTEDGMTGKFKVALEPTEDDRVAAVAGTIVMGLIAWIVAYMVCLGVCVVALTPCG